MLRWAMLFLLVAGALGLTGSAGAAVSVAKGLFFIAIVLFVVTLIAGIVAGRSVVKTISAKERRDDHHLSHR